MSSQKSSAKEIANIGMRTVWFGNTDPEGAKLPRDRRRRFAKTEALEVKKQSEELLKAGISENLSQIQRWKYYLNQDGTERWCIDMRPRNAITTVIETRDPYKRWQEKESKARDSLREKCIPPPANTERRWTIDGHYNGIRIWALRINSSISQIWNTPKAYDAWKLTLSWEILMILLLSDKGQKTYEKRNILTKGRSVCWTHGYVIKGPE